MSDEEFDRMFSEEHGIAPSANFTRNVMDKVRTEAALPPPIPFPLKRALPGLVLCVLSLAGMFISGLMRPGSQHLPEPSGRSIWTAIGTFLWTSLSDFGGLLSVANAGGLGWIILALLLTYLSVKLSLRLAGGRIL
jgi:hypothetical protein